MAPWRAAKGVMRDAAVPLSTPLTMSCLLPSTPAGHAPRGKACSMLPTEAVWLPEKEKALSEMVLMTLVSSPSPWPPPQAMVVERVMATLLFR